MSDTFSAGFNFERSHGVEACKQRDDAKYGGESFLRRVAHQDVGQGSSHHYQSK